MRRLRGRYHLLLIWGAVLLLMLLLLLLLRQHVRRIRLHRRGRLRRVRSRLRRSGGRWRPRGRAHGGKSGCHMLHVVRYGGGVCNGYCHCRWCRCRLLH